MSVLLTISYQDINGVGSTNSFTVADNAAAVASCAAIKKLTNCKIMSAALATPVDISGVANNNAAANNVESAKFKMAVHLSANPPAGATARPGVTLKIPAPVGTYINGLTGDPANPDIVALLATVQSNRGEAMTKVDKVLYVK